MAIQQVLLSLQPFPDAVPERVLEGACTLAQLVGARLTVHLPQLDSDRSSWPVVMGAFPLDFPDLMQDLVNRSEANAAVMAEQVTKLAAAHDIALDVRRLLTTAYSPPAPLVDLARLHDLTILPVPETDGFNPSCVQATLFGSGRPVLLLPSQQRRLQSLDRITVAWDYSREAARAMADALPLLKRAREVRVVMVLEEKQINTNATRADLEKYLSAHAVRYNLCDVALEGDDIGPFLMDQAAAAEADLLVMGAYGHTRMREFVLGGATRAVLRAPLLPVFLSH